MNVSNNVLDLPPFVRKNLLLLLEMGKVVLETFSRAPKMCLYSNGNTWRKREDFCCWKEEKVVFEESQNRTREVREREVLEQNSRVERTLDDWKREKEVRRRDANKNNGSVLRWSYWFLYSSLERLKHAIFKRLFFSLFCSSHQMARLLARKKYQVYNFFLLWKFFSLESNFTLWFTWKRLSIFETLPDEVRETLKIEIWNLLKHETCQLPFFRMIKQTTILWPNLD